MKQWKVTISIYQYATTTVEAETMEEAERIVEDKLKANNNHVDDYYSIYDSGAYVVKGESEEVI